MYWQQEKPSEQLKSSTNLTLSTFLSSNELKKVETTYKQIDEILKDNLSN